MRRAFFFGGRFGAAACGAESALVPIGARSARAQRWYAACSNYNNRVVSRRALGDP